jgi:uncharacterized protein YdaU (DUF1376 family)
MAKDPAFLFYSQDFITGTMFFTDEQAGKYIRLLCAQHQHGHLSLEEVNYICRTNEPTILKKFVQDQDGLFFNERLEEEMKKRKSFCNSRKENIKKRYLNKGSNTYVATNVEHMENENENENINKEKGVRGEKQFKNPTLEEVKQYFREKGYTEQSAITAYEYYEAGGWIDSRGKKVKNWKQKMIAVWFNEQNKIKTGKILTAREVYEKNNQFAY